MKTLIKEKIRNNGAAVGSWITVGNVSVAEIMLRSGFDWLTVDMEHSAISVSEMQQLIQVTELGGCVPLVRVSENNTTLIKRAMDAGAHGVIVPAVNSGKEALAAVEATKYPPKGKRGVGLGRAQGYGLSFEEYKNKQSDTIVIAQIEHINAVECFDEILAVPGIDGFFVGPYDLSASLGRPGDFEHPEVMRALRKVKKQMLHYDGFKGVHVIPPDPSLCLDKIKEGYNFIAFCLDSLFLGETITSKMSALRSGLPNEK